MNSFKIYKKPQKYVWTRSRVIFISFAIVFLIFIIKVGFIGKTDSDIIEKIFGYLSITLMVAGLINSFFREQLKGTLDGLLKFENDGITIEERKFQLDDIRLIKIQITDYAGKQISTIPMIWEMYSSGVQNKVVIILNTGEVQTCYFQLQGENHLMRASDEVYAYYSAGKMLTENYDGITRDCFYILRSTEFL